MVLFTLFEYLPIVDSMPISFTQRGFSTQKYFKPEVNFEVNPLLNIFVAISRHPLDLWSVGVMLHDPNRRITTLRTPSPWLLWISVVRFSLLRIFKNYPKYPAYVILTA